MYIQLRGGLQYTRFLRENLAATLLLDILLAQADLVTFDGVSVARERFGDAAASAASFAERPCRCHRPE